MGVLPTWDENEKEKPKISFYDRLPTLLPKVEDDDSYEFNLIKEIKYFGVVAFILAVILFLYLQ